MDRSDLLNGFCKEADPKTSCATFTTDDSTTSTTSSNPADNLKKLLVPWQEDDRGILEEVDVECCEGVRFAKPVSKKTLGSGSGTSKEKMKNHRLIETLTDKRNTRKKESKSVQCAIMAEEQGEPVLPDELRTLLLNITLLLHELKTKRKESAPLSAIVGLINRLCQVLTNVSGRPVVTLLGGYQAEHAKKFEDHSAELNEVLKQHFNGTQKVYEDMREELNSVRKDLVNLEYQETELNSKLHEQRSKIKFCEEGTMPNRLKTSTTEKEVLKAEIDYNKDTFKRYKRLMNKKDVALRKVKDELGAWDKKIAHLGIVIPDELQPAPVGLSENKNIKKHIRHNKL